MSEAYINIIPSRYICHVTSPENRDSINKNGLLPSLGFRAVFKGKIFANNGAFPSNNWYPFNIDFLDDCLMGNVSDDLDFLEWAGKYDIWMIDTLKIKNLWYCDSPDWCIEPCLQIFTEEAIPRSALKLFKTEKMVHSIHLEDGVASTSYTGGLCEIEI